jgi:hypothetical protein
MGERLTMLKRVGEATTVKEGFLKLLARIF